MTTPCYAAPSLTDPSLKVEQVVSDLDLPTTMAFIGDNDILVLQKNDGRVRRVINGVLQSGEVLDVNVANDSEHGLLGIALHPDFASNHLVYLYYTESSTGGDGGSPLGNRVYQYTWDDSTGTLISPQLILNLPAASSNHNGGVIIFGPDGKLYIIIGDQNRDGQLQNFAAPAPGPDDTSVILRLNDDGSVPSDNPFHSLGDPMNKYYAYGIRNSFGMAFDSVAPHKLWDTENGENTYDEINLVEPGFNSGWQMIMGPDSRNSNNVSDLVSFAGSHYADPKFSWFDTVGPTAIVFLGSTGLGNQYQNDVFVGDINNGNLYHFQPNANRNGFIFTSPALKDLVADNNGGELNEVIFGTGFNGITDLKVGPDGLLYVISFLDGAIYRISLAAAPPFFNASSLPDAEVGLDYSANLGIGGGTPPYTVMVVKGSLPNGFTADSDGISGIPTSSTKKSVFTLQVTDHDQPPSSATKQFRIKVLKAPNISTQTLKRAKVGRNYKTSLKVSGGKSPFTWSLGPGTFPAWAQLSPSGVITGVPPAPDSRTFTLQVIDALGGTDQQSFTLTAN